MNNAQPRIIKRATLGLHHAATGNTRHYHGGTPLPSPASLIIVRFGDRAFNLVHLNAQGAEITDTFHETVDDAVAQANFEFSMRSDEWQDVDDPY